MTKLNLITKTLLGMLLTGISLHSQADDSNTTQHNTTQHNTTQLDTIVVSDEGGKNPNFNSYTKPSAVTSRAINVNAMQNLDSIVRSTSGAYTQMDPGQGGVSVNIRSMTGLGRVNTMIDGVPQTQLGTSANGGGKFHSEGNGPMSQFSALIDQNFLTRVDISKGHGNGSAGINSLMGSADFKTIDAEDVILDANKVGVLTRLNYGNNDLGKNGMIALAGKTGLLESGSISALVAGSKSSLDQNYRRGDGSHASDSGYMQGLKQHPESYLAKLAVKPNKDTEFKLSSRRYNNSIVGRDIDSKTHSFEAKYNPDSKWVDLSFLAAKTVTEQVYTDNAKLWTLEDATTQNKFITFDLKNTSRFELGDFNGSVTYGGNIYRNKYERGIPEKNNDSGAIANAAFGPAGKQNINSLYLDSEFNYDILTLNAGLTYSRYNLKGYKPACDSDDAVYCMPAGAMNIDRKYTKVNPSVTLSLQVTDWLQPFVSYSETARAPNVQEMFNTSRNGLSVNPYLKPETAKTYEIGFNINKDNLLLDNDLFGMKVVYFNSHIKDYIFNMSYYGCGSSVCTNVNDSVDSVHAQIYLNSPEMVKDKGWEVEMSYESDYFFSNMTYTRSASTAPTSKAAMIYYGFGSESYTQLPKDYATVELGTHLLDKKLTLSSIFKYTGKAKRVGLDMDDDGNLMFDDLPNIPVIIDLYANYKINKNISLKAGIQNLMNRNYLDALNAYNSSTSEDYDTETDTYRFTNSARGRTYTVGAEIRF
ncbi:TonB-dependent receptor domain-containing protein [Pasteurella bettyae]|uniref:TonB-dependent heme/hemoglobin receptor family protein n=1 Tax=Pasteurella bettyae CCUG 2042 TaxID=1095749 RepID=I3D6W3_9PAST|nr:TonB-dependent receptor [Pasteurella bettyae]EIJ67456.1 TonB-dependent heme/hemoglobin receptor family protein [Pasteurella bettyae CCUG 2042]SUB21817.1 TonB-dependent heme receptor A [Pasteurella bettyae]